MAEFIELTSFKKVSEPFETIDEMENSMTKVEDSVEPVEDTEDSNEFESDKIEIAVPKALSEEDLVDENLTMTIHIRKRDFMMICSKVIYFNKICLIRKFLIIEKKINYFRMIKNDSVMSKHSNWKSTPFI